MYLSQSQKAQVSHDLLCEPAIASSNHSGGKLGYPCPLVGRGCETHQLAFLPSNISKLAVIILQESKPTL